MTRRPYQPFLLRILHGVTGICLVLAMITAFWTYTVYDGRWISLPLPNYKEIEGIHGTFGLYTLLIFPVFVWYAFHRGQRKLIQPDDWQGLSQVGYPRWWRPLSRFVNTLSLIALTFALFSGKMMSSEWLPKGELTHLWYYAHLIAWVVMVVTISLHVLINAQLGGVPLLRSMWHIRSHPQDSPRLWKKQIYSGYVEIRGKSRQEWMRSLAALPQLELAIGLTIVAAWIISTTKEIVAFISTL